MNAPFQLYSVGAAFAAALFTLSVAAPLASAETIRPDDETTYLKDIVPRQRDMVVRPPAPAASAPQTNSALAIKTTVDRPDARYTHGDSIELSVEVTEDAYVWVFDTGTSGKVHQIFPNEFDGNNFVRANAPVAIPGKDADYQLVVSHPKGAELITVIAAKDNIRLTQDLIEQETRAGPFYALRGNATSVAKDIKIGLKKTRTKWTSDHRVIHVD